MRRDMRKELAHLYSATSEAVMVDVPSMWFLMVDGQGDPNTSAAYQDGVKALYSLAYAIKFQVKRNEGGLDLAVMPLEGLWWADDMQRFALEQREHWQWRIMIAQPDPINEELVESSREELARKRDLPALKEVRYEAFHEGRAAQLLHVGPYAEEARSLAKLHAFIEAQDCELRGCHHEIYLKDPARTRPDRLQTILRQPV